MDEERLARVNLRRLLEHFPEIEIAGEAYSCKSALELINLNNPQLIFLDIQLSGETGFDLLELIDNSVNIPWGVKILQGRMKCSSAACP